MKTVKGILKIVAVFAALAAVAVLVAAYWDRLRGLPEKCSQWRQDMKEKCPSCQQLREKLHQTQAFRNPLHKAEIDAEFADYADVE